MVNYSAYHWAEKARKAAEEAGKISDLSDYLNKTSTEEQVINSPIVVTDSLTLTDNKGGAITTSIVNGIPTVASNNGIEVISKVDFEKEIIAPNQLDYSRITNCLTNIPQDIKLELVDGTLTLKAGSKLYVPNGFDIVGETSVTYYGWVSEELAGDVIYTVSPTPNVGDQIYSYNGVDLIEIIKVTNFDGNTLNLAYSRVEETDITLTTGDKIPKFDVIEVINDKVIPMGSNTGTGFIFLSESGSGTPFNIESNAVSGSTDSIAGRTYHIWYDTQNNLIKRYGSNGTTPTYNVSFPIVKVTVSNGSITSIDQIFNGFGYIGSTVFALPGVKGLIPNGRNADGSLKNIEFEFDKVVTLTDGGSFNHYLAVYDNLNLVNPITTTYDENRNYNTNNGNIENLCIVGTFSRNNGVISNFNTKTPFQAVDRNDSSWLSGLGMPSDKYVDLTLGASGSKYTAPANGFYYLNKVTGGNNQYIALSNTSAGGISVEHKSSGTGDWLRAFIFAKKGDIIDVAYNASGTTNNFRFIYAQGETE